MVLSIRNFFHLWKFPGKSLLGEFYFQFSSSGSCEGRRRGPEGANNSVNKWEGEKRNMSVVHVNIVGVAVEPGFVEYSEGDSTQVVKDDLQRAFGGGILKHGGRGFARPTLVAGEYQYHVTVPAGGQPGTLPFISSGFLSRNSPPRLMSS